MNRTLYLIFTTSLLIVVTIQHGLTQDPYKFVFAIEENEPNSTFQVHEIDGQHYFSGLYFDQDIGRWTAFYAKANTKGEMELLGTEKIDIVIGLNISNVMMANDSGLYILGQFTKFNYLVHYNFNLDTVFVSDKLDIEEHNITASGFSLTNSLNTIVYTGRTIEDPDNRDIIVVSDSNDKVTSYIDYDPNYNSYSSNPIITEEGDLYLIGNDVVFDGINNDKTYVICLDNDLNLKFSTKGTENEQRFRLGKGICLDKDQNILCTGTRLEFTDGEVIYYPLIAKFDLSGKLIWEKTIGKPNINNSGWGRWENIIETQEQDGYIVVGSRSIQGVSGNDSLFVDAAIAKLSYDGDSIWYYTFSYRGGGNNLVNTFYDISATSDGGYFIGGSSSDFNKIDSLDNPWLQTILLKISPHGEIENIPTSLVEQEDIFTEITVFPNPAIDHIYINQKGNDSINVQIINSQGQIIESFELVGNHNTIIMNVKEYNPGIYYIIGTVQNGKVSISKLIVH